MRKMLVTSALPYANGHIHLGHLVEYIQTDIWVRFQKLQGNRCVYMCADDTHGTAVMLRAKQEDISEEELIENMHRAHASDFAGFDIEFDNYGSTHCPENRALCEEIWASIRKADMVHEQEVEQLYDTAHGMFLADRQVRGACPRCKATDQPGDNCSECGAHYSPTELIDPISVVSKTKPEIRKHPHLFINIEKEHAFLNEWTQSGGHLQPEISNYLKAYFLNEPLKDWDVSRPDPYFGFQIPDSPGNYWYVWFDAPIGYIASTWQWCKRVGEDFDQWWDEQKGAETEIHHFIGKDITYFHTLFWPAMLKISRFSLPRTIHIHGFLTVDGEKMSKSKGTFVLASTYLKYLDPNYLRYYYAAKLSDHVDDIDLNLDEFAARVNSDMVGNIVNLASRTARFAGETGLADAYPDDGGLFRQAADDGKAIADAYEACDYSRAMRLVLAAGDRANKYVEDRAPWNLKKEGKADELRNVCTVGLNLFRQLVVYLAPVLPELARKTGELLGEPIERWSQSQSPLLGVSVGKFAHMMKRVERSKINLMIADSAAPADSADSAGGEAAADEPLPAAPADSDEPLRAEPLAEQCTIDDFLKVDLRVARVLTAEKVPDAAKLLKLTLGLGGEATRTVFAGIKQAYDPESLVGQLVVCVANLKPRKMKFGVSEGMIVASGPGGKDVFLLHPDRGALPGQRVH